MKNIYRTATNSVRFVDADVETITLYTRSDMTSFVAGDVVTDPQGRSQTILKIEALPAGLSRVLLAAL